MSTESSIFTSGEATSENTIFGVMKEIKIDLTLRKKNNLFCFFLCLSLNLRQNNVFQCVSHRERETTFFVAVLRQI